MKKRITAPFTDDLRGRLTAGEMVFLSGVIYAMRDQAHLRVCRMLENGEELPFQLSGQVVYYCGPTPARDGHAIGSCGPTTSARMDRFTPGLLDAGLRGMIGKGARSVEVNRAVKRNGAVYFLAPAGCGAYLSKRVLRSELVAFEELGPEAVRRLEVKEMPLVVALDGSGGDIFSRSIEGG